MKIGPASIRFPTPHQMKLAMDLFPLMRYAVHFSLWSGVCTLWSLVLGHGPTDLALWPFLVHSFHHQSPTRGTFLAKIWRWWSYRGVSIWPVLFIGFEKDASRLWRISWLLHFLLTTLLLTLHMLVSSSFQIMSFQLLCYSYFVFIYIIYFI